MEPAIAVNVAADLASDRRSATRVLAADPDRVFRVLEYTVAGAALVASTGGPYQLLASLEGRFQLGDENPELARLFGVFAAFALVSLYARWPAYADRRRRNRVGGGLAAASVLWAFASSMWSVDPTITREKALVLGFGSILGLWLGLRFPTRTLLVLVAASTSVAAAWSLFAVRYFTYPIYTTLNAGGWQGIYGHNNLLGAALAPGILSTATAAYVSFSGRPGPRGGRAVTTRRWLGAVWVLGCGLQLTLLARASSAGSVLALLLGIGVLAALATLLWGSRPTASSSVRAWRRWPIATAGAVSVAALVIPLVLPASSLNRVGDWRSRLRLWHAIGPVIRERLLAGSGYGSFWTHRTPEAATVDARFGAFAFHAHNGLVEILLGVGVIGLALFAAQLTLVLVRQAETLSRFPGPAPAYALWPLAVLVTLVATTMVESIGVSPPSLLLILLVAFALKPASDPPRASPQPTMGP